MVDDSVDSVTVAMHTIRRSKNQVRGRSVADDQAVPECEVKCIISLELLAPTRDLNPASLEFH